MARLATTRPGGRVDLVPVVFALDGLGRIVTAVDHKPKRHQRLQRLDNVRAHPEVTVLADHYDDDWTALWWVRVRGRAVVAEDGPAHSAAVEALVAKYHQYRDRAPQGAAILIEVTELSGWRART